jgi:hypothetical protein
MCYLSLTSPPINAPHALQQAHASAAAAAAPRVAIQPATVKYLLSIAYRTSSQCSACSAAGPCLSCSSCGPTCCRSITVLRCGCNTSVTQMHDSFSRNSSSVGRRSWKRCRKECCCWLLLLLLLWGSREALRGSRMVVLLLNGRPRRLDDAAAPVIPKNYDNVCIKFCSQQHEQYSTRLSPRML